MIEIIDKHNINLTGKKVTVLGAGRSGLAAATLIQNVGGIPFISEFKNEDPMKIKINNRIEKPIVKTIRHSVGPELLPEDSVSPDINDTDV